MVPGADRGVGGKPRGDQIDDGQPARTTEQKLHGAALYPDAVKAASRLPRRTPRRAPSTVDAGPSLADSPDTMTRPHRSQWFVDSTAVSAHPRVQTTAGIIVGF